MKFVVPDFPGDSATYPKAIRKAVGTRQNEVFKAFAEHNERLRPQLPPDLQHVLDFTQDDALIRSLYIDPRESLVRLNLVVGDLQRGYFDWEMNYQGIELSQTEVQALCLIAYSADDIYWTELDIVPDTNPTQYVHRIRWHSNISIFRSPDGANHILTPDHELRFTDFQLIARPKTTRRFRRDKDFITVVPDPDFIEGL